MAQRLGGLIREDDSLIRLGRDEFLLIATDMHGESEIREVLGRIREAAGRPIEVAGTAVRVTLSIGVCLCPDHGESAPQLLACADAAMYRAKHEGQNRVVFYSEEIEKRRRNWG